jgi:chloramphenicol-sensitive protein RarD
MNKGIVLAVSAYIFWGLHPIYWKLLIEVSSYEIVAHRIFWSFAFFVIINLLMKNWKPLLCKFKSSKNKKILLLTALLISSNWSMYIWAVNAGFIVETSLGYFISPLVIVILGVVILKEKLRSTQWIAIALAAAGVLYLAVMYGQIPWISLFLAFTWGLYGMLRKKISFSSIEGLTLETAFLAVISITYIIYLFATGTNSFLAVDLKTNLLLIGSGIMSGLPLMIFIHASKKIELSLIGILQYIYPTLLFLIGVFIYDEQLNITKLTGFLFIWCALLIYSAEGLFQLRVTRTQKLIPEPAKYMQPE